VGDRLVNLYELRRAIAALVWVRHNTARLNAGHLDLIDTAVGHLVAARANLHGEFAAAAGSLLSTDTDIGGRRTVRAIDRLGELAHVDAESAEAIASLQPSSCDTGPLRLFDPDSAVSR
jgi:hypothetical protein